MIHAAIVHATAPAGLPWIVPRIAPGNPVNGAVLSVPCPPLQDFGRACQGHVLARLLEGAGDVRLTAAPVPNGTVQAILGLLATALAHGRCSQVPVHVTELPDVASGGLVRRRPAVRG